MAPVRKMRGEKEKKGCNEQSAVLGRWRRLCDLVCDADDPPWRFLCWWGQFLYLRPLSSTLTRQTWAFDGIALNQKANRAEPQPAFFLSLIFHTPIHSGHTPPSRIQSPKSPVHLRPSGRSDRPPYHCDPEHSSQILFIIASLITDPNIFIIISLIPNVTQYSLLHNRRDQVSPTPKLVLLHPSVLASALNPIRTAYFCSSASPI